MIDIRPFRHEDFGLATRSNPLARENTFGFEQRNVSFESKQVRRHYVALDSSQVVAYGCLEHPSEDSKTWHVVVVCSPANLRREVGQGLYFRLFQDAKALGATTLWAHEYHAGEHLREFLTSRAFIDGRSNALLDHAPIVTYRLHIQ